jgi:hypothetical protein
VNTPDTVLFVSSCKLVTKDSINRSVSLHAIFLYHLANLLQKDIYLYHLANLLQKDSINRRVSLHAIFLYHLANFLQKIASIEASHGMLSFVIILRCKLVTKASQKPQHIPSHVATTAYQTQKSPI